MIAKLHTKQALAAIRRLYPEVMNQIDIGFHQTISYAYRLAKETTAFQDRTMRLRGSIKRYYRKGLWRGYVSAGEAPKGTAYIIEGAPGKFRHVYYAQFVEHGTRAHGPVNKLAMMFYVNGQKVFSQWVRGIRPRKYMTSARNQSEQASYQFFASGLNQVIR